jgi:hypothetical protein
MIKTITSFIMITTIIFWCVWDAIVYFYLNDVDATISKITLDLWEYQPTIFIPFFILLGHLFFPQYKYINRGDK